MCPFQDNDDLLIHDHKLMRYLFVSLPLMQKIVDNLLNSLLFKFQSNLYFLNNFFKDCVLIFKQKEINSMEVYKQTMKETKKKREDTEPDNNDSINGEKDFNYFITKECCFEIKVNILKIKEATFDYLRKVITVFDIVLFGKTRTSDTTSSKNIIWGIR